MSVFELPRRRSPMDLASIKDRVYFERYPEETSYLRPYIPGEFGPNFPSAEIAAVPGEIQVEVKQLAPAVRRRRPAFIAVGVPR